MPTVGTGLPGERPGFTAGDPRPWIPNLLRSYSEKRIEFLPWSSDCDLLLAPYPAPGEETRLLIEQLRTLPPDYSVALYERDVPVLPNLLIGDHPVPATIGAEAASSADVGHEFASEADGLRAYRSAFRHQGRGFAEAYVFLPAKRMVQLLSGSFFAEIHPGPGGSLQNRRFLTLALDHQRSLALLAPGVPTKDALPRAERVLAVVPHFDDDVLLCGGALIEARARGAEVAVVWMTDGRKGVSTVSEEESVRIRHAEAEAAMVELGIEQGHFLDAPETELTARGPWRRRLRDILCDFQPDRVHTVWWADNNIDHYETNRALMSAWPRQLNDVLMAVSGVWTPMPGDTVVAIDDATRQRKDRALSAYASQIAEVDYLRVERGLSRWQARNLRGASFAEAYHCLPAQDYWRRFRFSGIPRRVFLRRRR